MGLGTVLLVLPVHGTSTGPDSVVPQSARTNLFLAPQAGAQPEGEAQQP
jgi:hypothetical protein